MNKLINDRTGKRFGKLVVLGFAGSPAPKYNSTWLCKCDCGNETTVIGHKLGKETFSCGCLRIERTRESHTTHGESRKNGYLYAAWCNAKSRCKPEWIEPWNYYDRGIKVCAEWVNDYVAFRDWILTNIGHRPKKGWSIDRIDNDRGYEPGNIRWATPSRQGRNRRGNIIVTYKGETGVLRDICEKHGLDFPFIWGRMNKGRTFEDALTTPKHLFRKTGKFRNMNKDHK
jgi:hypothetical protein